MFDDLLFEGKQYQTKDTPAQALETYEIRGDELWMKKVEREWVENEEAIFGGYLEELSHEWIFCEDFDGAIRFYRDIGKDGNGDYIWEEYKTLFMDGKMIKCERIENDK